jgi:hypothetical protein
LSSGWAETEPAQRNTKRKTRDGRVDAVGGVFETDATVSTPTVVFLMRAGGEPKGDPIFSADHLTGLRIRWLSHDELSIGADHARIYHSEGERVMRLEDGERTVRLRYDIRTQEPVSRPEDYGY